MSFHPSLLLPLKVYRSCNGPLRLVSCYLNSRLKPFLPQRPPVFREKSPGKVRACLFTQCGGTGLLVETDASERRAILRPQSQDTPFVRKTFWRTTAASLHGLSYPLTSETLGAGSPNNDSPFLCSRFTRPRIYVAAPPLPPLLYIPYSENTKIPTTTLAPMGLRLEKTPR